MADQDSTRNENTNIEHSRQTLRRSFGNAWAGIIVCVIEERNIKIHCIAAVLVVIFGLILDISMTEWYICFTLFWQPLAKRAKDCAAGAVLIAAIWAAVTGGIIFFPKLIAFIADLIG